jgi:hypothetical protein
MRISCAVCMSLLISMAAYGKLKIEKSVDRLTKQTVTQAKGLKLCQPRESGAFAKCATLSLAWMPELPDSVALRLEFPETVSVQELAINVDGSIQVFKATTAVTDFNYDPNLARLGMSGASSVNTFLIPVAALRSLCKDAASGMLRVTGVHSSLDFDFWRQAKMKGLPADDLRQFLDEVVPVPQ